MKILCRKFLGIWLVAVAVTSSCHCSDLGDRGSAAANFDSDPIVGPKRKLLQESSDISDTDYESATEAAAGKPAETTPKPVPTTPRTMVKPGEPRTGPTLFYDGDSFMMQVGKPIQVTVFKDGVKDSVIDLDQSAASVKGGMTGEDTLRVNIDWKNANFGDRVKISSIQIHMEFQRVKKEYMLRSMELKSLRVGGREQAGAVVSARTVYDYTVKTPLGLSWGCGYPGLFPPASQGSGYSFGLTFPDVQLQAFGLKNGGSFGPEWTCGDFLPTGVWLGLIFGFFFALVVYWGITMLANVETMDRFDDPKGKTIYVPQTE